MSRQENNSIGEINPEDYSNERDYLKAKAAKRCNQESDGDEDSDTEGRVDYFCSQNRYHKTQTTMLDKGVQIAPGEDKKPEYFLDHPNSEFCHFFDIYGGNIFKYPQKCLMERFANHK